MNMAESLNLGCLCSTLQPQLLHQELDEALRGEGLAQALWASRPHLFSASPVFLSSDHYARISNAVAALHRVASLPGYQAQALSRAPQIAQQAFGPKGAFMGYDFHLGAQGPQLIEINTNAGGAFLQAAAVRAHRACCTPLDHGLGGPVAGADLESAFMDMFRAEWRQQRGDAPLRTVAIVDDEPASQYLAPEFELARQMFQRAGLAAVISDPRELQWRDGQLWHPALSEPVDMVYNRLTDFYLAESTHAPLREAYLHDAVVVTPHPHAHALHADKRNLIALSDSEALAAWGAGEQDLALLRQVVPTTVPVMAERADDLWAQRRQLFFKPATGFGSRGAYRGDKLTRRVWDEIVADGGFVAQALVPPSERAIAVEGVPNRLKVDIRAYAYDGQVQLLAARTYNGQTTNFRTPGGGFSPVAIVPSIQATPCHCQT